ncbi:hypothetical protein M501DRAFT_996535 [Patellaria atrata CBS 101060]|uniref:USP domain-containing protein n=1 Tax=Patellaria atrata CBS 101060 TaxID=1346257 RepID=A0A9P4S883_9PEZI|nr:hypothetical protein M501DRAFT_996535 [Patellaria atrata CBS 101060]
MDQDVVMEQGEYLPQSRAPSSEPSLPRRDSIEDANPELTRKRPRVDSGEQATRNMSTEPVIDELAKVEPDSPTASPTASLPRSPHEVHTPNGQEQTVPQTPHSRQSSRVTINVRTPLPNHPPRDPGSPIVLPEPVSDIPMDSHDTAEQQAQPTRRERADSLTSNPSSPFIEMIADGDEEELRPEVIALDGSGSLAEAILETFPVFGHEHPEACAKAISHHFGTAPVIDMSAFTKLCRWFYDQLVELQSHKSEWKAMYKDQMLLWDELQQAMLRLLSRRNPLGEEYESNQLNVKEEPVQQLLTYYAKICSRFIQLDVEYLETIPVESVEKPYLVSVKPLKFLRALFNYRNEETPLWGVLRRSYHMDPTEVCMEIVQEWLAAPSNGMVPLLQLAKSLMERIQFCPSLRVVTLWTTHITMALSFTVFPSQLPMRIGFPKYLVSFFRAANDLLQKSVDKKSSSLPADFYRELMGHLADQLRLMGGDDDPFSKILFREIAKQDEGVDLDHVTDIVPEAWRFNLLKRYLAQTKHMELRVLGVDQMATSLVNAWSAYYKTDGPNHPVLQYLSKFLLRTHVIDDIFGVDAHEQVISKSGNVVAFPLVIRNYTENETDAIWRTITTSLDPLVVTSTLNIIGNIVPHMQFSEVIYLCGKFRELSLEAFTHDVCQSLRSVFHRIRQHGWPESEDNMCPFEICIRLLQVTSLPGTTAKNTQPVQQMALQELTEFCRSGAMDQKVRIMIYDACISDIRAKSANSTGSLHAIFIVLQICLVEDRLYLLKKKDLLRLVVEEVCYFSQHHRNIPPSSAFTSLFEPRFKLLSELIVSGKDDASVPIQQEDELWSVLVGRNAVNNDVRILAWQSLAYIFRDAYVEHGFLQRIVNKHLPALEPEYFLEGIFFFLQQVIDYQLRVGPFLSVSDDGMLKIPSGETLWRVITSASDATIAERTANLLSRLYMEGKQLKGLQKEVIEAAHMKVVDECIKQLQNCYTHSRSYGEVTTTQESDTRSFELQKEIEAYQRHFTRTIMFLQLALQQVRRSTIFSPPSPKPSTRIIVKDSNIKGNLVVVRFQPHSNGKAYPQQDLEIGDLETLADFHKRISEITGFPRFRVIFGGMTRDFSTDAQTVRDAKIAGKGLVLIHKAHNPEQDIPATHMGRSTFERQLLSHFDHLYSFMDAEDTLSKACYEFLTLFPAHQKVVDAVRSSNTAGEDVFPLKQGYRILYSIRSLEAHLVAQQKASLMDDRFIKRGIHLLTHAITNNAFAAEHLEKGITQSVVESMLNCLLLLLKERPLPQDSAKEFPEESLLVERLLSYLQLSLAPSDRAKLATACYAILIEASLHSNKIWETFKNTPGLTTLHNRLLLADPRVELRESIARCIGANLGALSTSTSPSVKEFSSFYWHLLLDLVPSVMEFPTQSNQFFIISAQLFDPVDDVGHEESTLKSYLFLWSQLLLQYEHYEVVGKEEADEVVMGLTKLIYRCIQYLKSFKKPLHQESLAKNLFIKFLFTPLSCENNNQDDVELGSWPLLESRSRKGVYDVLLALCEDYSTHRTLLALNAKLMCGDNVGVIGFHRDRKQEIRAPSGYVGMRNLSQTCYMNSLLTQLFMNVDFRRFIIESNILDEDKQQLLKETQSLFAYMQESYARCADPKDFAMAVRNYGEQIDVTCQMDVGEFYNSIFDQWEEQMLSDEMKKQFRSFYGGQVVNQTKSKECEHVSEMKESFFAIQCDVAGKSRLEESLKSFVRGNVCEGSNKYKCESCDGRLVDAVRRTCLKDVPDNLIFHLKRFEFDVSAMAKSKVNEYFEFPDSIDVSPYTFDHLNEPDKPINPDWFNLVGVLVHRGGTESGHYYSYMRERPLAPGAAPRWVQFNDDEVTDFDLRDIPELCFGGQDPFEPHKLRTDSAYLLFYQRASKLEADSEMFVRGVSPKAVIPQDLKTKILQDNEFLLREYCLFDPGQSQFVRELLVKMGILSNGICSDDHGIEQMAIETCLSHLQNVVSRTMDLPDLDSMMYLLDKVTSADGRCSQILVEWFFIKSDTGLQDLLVEGPPKVRVMTLQLLAKSLQLVREKSPVAYFGEEDGDSESESLSYGTGLLNRITAKLADMILYIHTALRAWDDFFQFLSYISALGIPERVGLLNAQCLRNCLVLLVAQSHTGTKQSYGHIAHVLLKRHIVISWQGLTDFVNSLLSSIDLKEDILNSYHAREAIFDANVAQYPLVREEYDYLCLWDTKDSCLIALGRILETWDSQKEAERQKPFIPSQIVRKLLEASPKLGLYKSIFQTLRDGIKLYEAPYRVPYVRAAAAFCQNCVSDRDAQTMIDIIIDSANEMDSNGGFAHLTFFYDILYGRNDRISVKGGNFLYEYAISTADHWAPLLLTFEHLDVRIQAIRLLRDVIFAYEPSFNGKEEYNNEIVRLKAVRGLVADCSKRATDAYENELPRMYMQPVIDCIEECIIWIEKFLKLEDIDDNLKSGHDRVLLQKCLAVRDKLVYWIDPDQDVIQSGDEWNHSEEFESDSDDLEKS